MFRDLDGISTSVTFPPEEFIDHEIKKRVDETRDQLASDKMAYEIRHYIHCLQHDHFWVQRIQNDINKLIVNREYIDFFIRIYEKWRTYNRMKCLPHCEKMALSQFKVYIEAEKNNSIYCVQQL